jgi:hypothetical protein
MYWWKMSTAFLSRWRDYGAFVGDYGEKGDDIVASGSMESVSAESLWWIHLRPLAAN